MITQSGNIMSARWWPGELQDAAKECASADQLNDRREDSERESAEESEQNDQASTPGARK